MIAVIKGDIVDSRSLKEPEKWLEPLKEKFSEWGETPKNWELAWGDAFQLEVSDVAQSLWKALQIKALIRGIAPFSGNISTIDVRMSIGIGRKEYVANRISESNGDAFHRSGERFESLKKEKRTLALKSPWDNFDAEINLYLKLACTFMDTWSVSSANLVRIALQYPNATQTEIGKILKIKQNSVSGRWSRANMDEVREVEKMFRIKIKNQLK